MIVEDQAILAMELEMVLGDAGYSVVGCAMDQPGAFAIARSEAPELALVDVNLLDGLTGPDLAARLVQDHGIAVIFLTANPEQIPDGYAGALRAVSKPFDEQTIQDAVAFAARYQSTGRVGEVPRRFRTAPWLATLGRADL
jgi:CheY-like chemotaxis protein